MIHDDKTTEIIIPTTPPSTAPAHKLPSGASSPVFENRDRASGSDQLVIAKTHWLHSLQAELSEDWTLRVLAALTILVLSLLVL